jgi:ABC-type oligopeptide transport system substrate-binding subunit
LIVVKDPNYWDAANVKLDGIEFYPLDEQTTMMNLYKSGRIDALYNHTVPGPWNEASAIQGRISASPGSGDGILCDKRQKAADG